MVINMSTMVIKASGLISNPLNTNNALVGIVQTSDSFSGSGLLFDQMTDAALGGDPFLWKKFSAFGAGIFEKIDDEAHFIAGSTGAVYIDKAFVDVAVSWTVSKLTSSSAPAGSFGAFVDVRRSNENLKMYRIGFNSTHLGLVWRDGGMSTLASCPIVQGDKILYTAKGNSHNVYVNGDLKISTLHEGTAQSGYVGLSGADSVAFAAFDDLIVYSLD